MQKTITFSSLVTMITVGLSACAPIDIKQAMENQAPKVSVANQRLTRLDFERINLAFDIKVDNPNPVGIQLAGLDYDLKLADQSFASGKQDKYMALAASGASHFELPLSMAFSEIYQAISSLKDKDQIPYELTTVLMIDVPLLGKMRYPVKAQGVLPLPRLPDISVKDIRLEKLNFSGATLALNLQVDNPNAFSVAMNKLNYDFKVNGKRWASGNKQTLGTIKTKQKNIISLPISLNFMELGSGLYSLLNSGKDLNYSLSGKLDASSSNQLIGNFDMPFDTNGRVKLSQ
ncbi:MAG: LEA type 2 family protein [Pseudomonadota bacterium]